MQLVVDVLQRESNQIKDINFKIKETKIKSLEFRQNLVSYLKGQINYVVALCDRSLMVLLDFLRIFQG